MDEVTVIHGGAGALREATARDPLRVRIAACPVEDLAPLADSTVEHLELSFTFVEDLAPLLAAPALRTLRLFGNPLSRVAFREQLPALRARLDAVEASPEAEWQVARRIRDAGIRACYGATPWASPMLVVPGGRVAVLYPSEVDAALADGTLLSAGWVDPAPVPDALRLLCPFVTGTADDARDWIARADVYEPDRERLLRFVDRFPRARFFRDTEARLARWEQTHGAAIPPRVREQRLHALAGAEPARSYFVGRVLGQRYELGLLGWSNTDREGLERDQLRVMPVGESVGTDETTNSVLALSLESGDHHVYRYHGGDDLFAERRMGRTPEVRGDLVYESWAQLLAYTEAIEIDGIEVPATTERAGPATTLTLLGDDDSSLERLRGMTHLRRLRIACMAVTDLSPLASLTSLTHLALHFTQATDASPILALPSLRRASLVGNPWDDASYERLASTRRPRITVSPHSHWQLTRRLFARGQTSAFGSPPGAATMLVCCERGAWYIADFAEATEAAVAAAVDALPDGAEDYTLLDTFPPVAPGTRALDRFFGPEP